jgi:hypothetical protein
LDVDSSHFRIRELNTMKNALIMFAVLSIALAGFWGMCSIHGQTAALPAARGIGVQHGLNAPMDLTVLDLLFRPLWGTSPFVLAAGEEEEEEGKPDIKEEDLTPGPDRNWTSVLLA